MEQMDATFTTLDKVDDGEAVIIVDVNANDLEDGNVDSINTAVCPTDIQTLFDSLILTPIGSWWC